MKYLMPHLIKSIALILLFSMSAYAGDTINPHTGNLQKITDFQTEDGATVVYAPETIKVTNGTLTDNGDGTASLAVSGTTDGDLIVFDDDDSNFTATNVDDAISELDNDSGASAPNQADYKVNWNQIGNMPAGFADGTDADSGGATAYDDIGDPDANSTINFNGYTITWATTLDNGTVLTIDNTDADLANDTYLVTLQYKDDGDANAHYLRCIDDSAGAPNTVFSIGVDGQTYIDGLLSIGGNFTTNAQADIEGYASIGNGSALDASFTTIIDRDFTESGASNMSQLIVGGDMTADTFAPGTCMSFTQIGTNNIDGPSCGMTADAVSPPVMASLALYEPNITEVNGGAALLAATLYIKDAPTEGTSNAAIRVDSGNIVCDDTVEADSMLFHNVLNAGADDDPADVYIHSGGGIYIYEASDDFIASAVCKDGAAEWQFNDDVNIGASGAAENLYVWGDISTIGGGDLVFGNITARIGDGTEDSFTIATDGTGDGEIVLPNDSIGPAEMAVGAYDLGTSLEADTLTEGGVGVPNTGDNLSVFAATTSAQLYGVLSDETGSASGSPLAVFNQAPAIDGNIKNTPHHLIATIPDPNTQYGNDTQICLWPLTSAAITITKIEVTLDAAGNEVAGDLKYADTFIGLANATVINDFDTTSGVRSDSSITSGSVAASKSVYLQFDSQPNAAITQMSIDITFDYD